MRHVRLFPGYLLEKLAHNPGWLEGCSHIVLDEAHERSTETDLLAMLLRRLRGSLPQCRSSGLPHVTVMSATLQVCGAQPKLCLRSFGRLCDRVFFALR